MVWSIGTDQDPRLGAYQRRRNYLLGFGLGGGLEFFGRMVDYQNPGPVLDGAPDINGPRDISANLKWQLPLAALWPADVSWRPDLAVGATDLGGGMRYFGSVYAVASVSTGPLRWTLGRARPLVTTLYPKTTARVLDGWFGGAELDLFGSGASLLLESNGSYRSAGVRLAGEPGGWFGRTRLIGSVQRTFGAGDAAGRPADLSSASVALVLPLEPAPVAMPVRREPAAVLPQADRAPPDVRPAPAVEVPVAEATVQVAAAPLVDPLAALQQQLRATGLERLRLGHRGTTLVIEYENHRYLHNELDAIGLVLGLAAHLAPESFERVEVITLGNGMALARTSVALAAWRAYLDDPVAPAPALVFERGSTSEADWLDQDAPSPTSRVRISLRPLLNYAVATEYGDFDYSLALQTRASVPLWRGAFVHADLVSRVDHSDNMEPGRIYADSLHRTGVQTVALRQSFWLGPQAFGTLGLGRFQYDDLGAEGDGVLYAPWNDDSLRLRGQAFRRSDDAAAPWRHAWTVLYQWRPDPALWVEAGAHKYVNGQRGPALGVVRWFGDVALRFHGRREPGSTFAGVELTLPIGPREGMAAAPLQLMGARRFGVSLRTRVAAGSDTSNWIRPEAARPPMLAFDAEDELLNAGRFDAGYLQSQTDRLRQGYARFRPVGQRALP